MRILVAPDKLRGSMSAQEACQAIEKGIKSVQPAAEVVLRPLADGGEGSLEVIFEQNTFQRITCTAQDPLNRPIETYYLRKGHTAYVEMALTSGLALLKPHERNPEKTTTYGTGLVIKHAIESGATALVLFVGGSATNDAAMGIATALGFVFLDQHRQILAPTGENLSLVRYINSPAKPIINITVATDVRNTFSGPNGAARVFSAQKGADIPMVERLDMGLSHMQDLFLMVFQKNIKTLLGAGAAGGLAGGLAAMLNATIQSGADLIFDILDIASEVKKADMVFTAEGKYDSQSLQGKLVSKLADLCQKHHKKIVVFCGTVDIETATTYGSCFSIIPEPTSLANAEENAEKWLIFTTKQLMNLVSA